MPGKSIPGREDRECTRSRGGRAVGMRADIPEAERGGGSDSKGS